LFFSLSHPFFSRGRDREREDACVRYRVHSWFSGGFTSVEWRRLSEKSNGAQARREEGERKRERERERKKEGERELLCRDPDI